MRSTRRLFTTILVALCLLFPQLALAAGTVTLASREPTEDDGKWKLKMTIDYGGIPQLPHVPMIFAFTPMVLYERALTDKSPEKPVLNRMPLSNQQGINESMDVGFSDGTGKIFKITKFDFIIRRDHGFEAGEYDLKIKREDDGVQMGQTIKLILKGDNPVVDRRAIVFAGEKKAKKVDADKGDDKKEEKKDDPAPAEDKKADEGGEAKSGDDVPKVPPKQGGCGCKVAGVGGDGAAAAVMAGALALGAARRRRRRSGGSSTRPT
jgi:MYXO-CTERM domain-containing protein